MTTFKHTGKCIWCGRKEPDVTFYTIPHIIPKSLGGTETGFDICDECNHYFGTAPKGRHCVPCVDHAVKEILSAFRMFGKNLNSNSYKSFRSAYFSYHHKSNSIKIRNTFNSSAVTRQFKRGLYEIFLQKYHAVTKDGNNPVFDAVRNFARYDLNDLPVYYAFNNVILSPAEEGLRHPQLCMGPKLLEDLKNNGMFDMWLMGHNFYIAPIPMLASMHYLSYLQKQANQTLIPANGNEKIFKLNNIEELDFFMQRFNN